MVNKKYLSRVVNIGGVKIGGNNPVRIQTMTSTDTNDRRRTRKQIKELAAAGAELIRLAVPDEEAANNLRFYKKHSPVPLIADIHFDWRLAIKAIEAGADKIRINPGNIGSTDKLQRIIETAKKHSVPIRLGFNTGSWAEYRQDIAAEKKIRSIIASVRKYIQIFEKENFFDLVISLKTPEVHSTILAYELLAENFSYPLHLGITEAGPLITGTVKSVLALGTLLLKGIGSTIRISLTADPVWEVRVARDLLVAAGLRKGVDLISCPTCGRCEFDIIGVVDKLEKWLWKKYPAGQQKKNLKVAVMGCVVNGPGEARDADIGIAGGKGYGLIFRQGKIVGRARENEWLSILEKVIDQELK